MTNSLIVNLLTSSVMVSLAGVVLYLVKPLINSYCSKRLHYYIWLVLAIRLLIPFGVSIPIPTDLFSQLAPENEISSNYEIIDMDDGYTAEIEGISGMTDSNITATDENIPMEVELSKTPNITLTPYDVCLGVVVGVAVILLIGRVVVYLKFKRMLMHSVRPVEDDIMLDQFDFIKEEMGIKRAVKLFVHDAIGSPMLIGILSPVIVLPSVLVRSDSQVNIDYVFMHEFTHFKNRDIIFKWLLQWVMCLHWFNPLAYLVCNECHRLCELCCDEAVTQKLSYNEKRAYGDTLLRSMELADAYAYPAVALTLAENTKLMKERLGEMMKKTRKNRYAAALSVVLASVITFSTLITGVYAASPIAPDTAIVKSYPNSSSAAVLPGSTASPSDVKAEVPKVFNIDFLNLGSSTKGLAVINLGSRTLTQGQRLLADVYWEGGGALMFLYTKEKLDAASVKKLIDNGTLPLDISDKTNLRINMLNNASPTLNFAVNKMGYIGWINDIPDSGEHYFYLIGLNDDAIKKVKGVIDPNYNLVAGDKLPRITKWSGSIGEVEKNGAIEVNATAYTGDKINYEFTAKKGDSMAIRLNSYLVGSYEVVFSTSDRTVIKAIPAFSKTQDVTLNNLPEGTVSMRLIGYNVSGSLVVEPPVTTLAPKTTSKDGTYISRADSLIKDFAKYSQFGVTYNSAQDAVFYNGNRVKLFVEFKPEKEAGMNYAFNLCYNDTTSASTLYLEAFKDTSGKIIGVRELNKETALDILGGLGYTSGNAEELALDSNINYYAMDATSVIDSGNIIAKDLTKDMASQSLKDWMQKCDKAVGCYILKVKTTGGYEMYIYYNGGGRYPWTMTANNSSVRIDLHSKTNMSTNDGYYLMKFTAPKDYTDIKVYLDGKELVIASIDHTSAAAQQSGIVCEGSVAANLTGFGTPFVANKGDKVTIRLKEDLWGTGLEKDKIKLKVIIGDNDENTKREISLSNKDREFSFTALQSATHWVKIVNDNMQSVNYKFEILTPSASFSEPSSQQTKPNAQQPGKMVCEGGIAANLTGPASSNQLTVKKGDKITISLAEDLSGLGLVKDNIKVTVMIGEQSVVLSNADREKTITVNNAGTFTVKIKNSNMQLVNYKFNLTINK